jgi:hypothetical protein
MADSPLAQLEQSFIDEYLRTRGHDPHALSALPAPEREALLKDASVYASSRLCEVESRSHFVHEVHDAIGDIAKPGQT